MSTTTVRGTAPQTATRPIPGTTPEDGAAEIVFVAHDVGGPGGMERQSGHLVQGLLDAGRRVTVVARTCTLGERDGLRFVRVAIPRRPAALAYPAFFLIGSMLAAGRPDAVLHTTGAIVANRADISTVHYCHRAAGARLDGRRASRPARLYRLNDAISTLLSRLGEAWCYRPARTSLLCAVSDGLAAELRTHFPAAASSVRAVPNGVDTAEFRPDDGLRTMVRADLGIAADTPLALFVGGDWGRKGLRHAVDALSLAPGWHLAVAGEGDRRDLMARAESRGTSDRLHLLGMVRTMPALYAAADAFVLPTAYEAFPLVTLEAAASGLPLLVTRVSGVEQLLHDDANGWFIAQDADDIAGRLRTLEADPQRARTMAAAARRAAGDYSWERMTEGYLALYDELAART